MKKSHIGFIGGGNMAASLLGGLIKNDYPSSHLLVFDTNNERCQSLASQYGIRIAENNSTLTEQADIIVIAVKPQIVNLVLDEIQPLLQRNRRLIVSIAAGIPINAIQSKLGLDCPIVRAMPNTPAQISCAATGLFANQFCSVEDRQKAKDILSSVGIALWVTNEAQMDIVTAVSGSGPAYFFLVIEALQEAAVALGLDAQTASQLVLQTGFGATKMALESSQSPDMLRKAVTSPGGTTEKALTILEHSGIKDIFYQALKAAEQRAKELAADFNNS